MLEDTISSIKKKQPMLGAIFRRRGPAGKETLPGEEPAPAPESYAGDRAEAGSPAEVIQVESPPEPAAPPETAPGDSVKPATEDGDKQDDGEGSSLASLFAGTGGEEESSLSALLELVPDITLPELMEELNNVREILRGRLDEQETDE